MLVYLCVFLCVPHIFYSVCMLVCVVLACENFFSKPSDQVGPRQPVTEAGVSLGLPLSIRPARQAQELKHMRKLNRHSKLTPIHKAI